MGSDDSDESHEHRSSSVLCVCLWCCCQHPLAPAGSSSIVDQTGVQVAAAFFCMMSCCSVSCVRALYYKLSFSLRLENMFSYLLFWGSLKTTKQMKPICCESLLPLASCFQWCKLHSDMRVICCAQNILKITSEISKSNGQIVHINTEHWLLKRARQEKNGK